MYNHKQTVNHSLLLILFLCVATIYGSAQLPKSFSHYNQVYGLPDNNIKAIAQDKYGYIWVGTENGLARFDGKYFTTFTSSPTLAALPSSDIYSIQNLDSNHLGVVTKMGLNIIDVEKMTSFNLLIPKGPIVYLEKANHLRRIHVGKNGDIYIVSRTGLYHFDKERNLVFRYDDYTTKESLNSTSFGEYSYWLNDETIVLSGKKGICRYNTRLKKMTPVTMGDKSFLLFGVSEIFSKEPNYYVLQPKRSCFIILKYDSDSLIYIDELHKIKTYSTTSIDSIRKVFTWRSNLFALNDSTFLLSGKFKGIYTLKLNTKTGNILIDTNIYFSDRKANSLFIDKRNKYWLGFSDGLSCEKSSPINLQQHSTASLYEAKSNRNAILQVAVTNKYLYGASTVSGGIHQFNKNTLDFEKTIPLAFPPFGNKSSFTIEKWIGDSILCGSDVGLFLYDEKRNTSKYVDMPNWDPKHNWVANLFLDSKKNMWITTNNSGGCYIWNPSEKQPKWFAIDSGLQNNIKEVYHIAEDKKGNIWMAGRGIARYNIAKKKVDLYIDRFSESQQEPTPVEAIVIDETGVVWFINGTSGLACYHPDSKKVDSFSTKDGLPDETLTGLSYFNGFIWIVSKNAIVKINCQSRKVSAVSSLKDVYYKNFFASKLVYDSITNSFYTGAGSSIIRFEPENKLYKIIGPDLRLVFVRTGNDSTIWFPPSTITVKWKNKNLTLFYNAINFDDADYQRYAFRTIINGKTSKWITQDDQRRIVFSDLKKGTTIVEIKVYSPQNAWPEKIIRFTIKVIAPFWKTTWFLLLCAVLVIATLYSIFKYRDNQAKRILKIRDDISKDLHDEIGATLSGIAMYSHLVKNNLENNDADSARHSVNIIQKSATQMVTKLNDIVWLINPQKESLEELIERLREYAHNMCAAKNITPHIQVQGAITSYKPSIEKRKNIFLFCKEAINNAVKYSNAKSLVLKFVLADNLLEIRIEDDGDGFNIDTIKKGNGLDNMQKRAADMNAAFFIQSAVNKGCSITLKITH